jgi:hypothetical protein
MGAADPDDSVGAALFRVAEMTVTGRPCYGFITYRWALRARVHGLERCALCVARDELRWAVRREATAVPGSSMAIQPRRCSCRP